MAEATARRKLKFPLLFDCMKRSYCLQKQYHGLRQSAAFKSIYDGKSYGAHLGKAMYLHYSFYQSYFLAVVIILEKDSWSEANGGR
jgi:hypothetical protein